MSDDSIPVSYAKEGIVGWSVDLWDGDGRGLRIFLDAETDTYEFALLFTKSTAEEKEILRHCDAASPGYKPTATNLKKLDPEDVVMMWGGLADKRRVVQFCRSVLALCEIGD